LRTEAHDLRTSMNKLCISKLLQVIEQDLIPTERNSAPVSRINKPAPQPITSTFGTSHTSSQPIHTVSGSSINSQPTFRSASGF
jgi:hypothetical protein